jgi:hypothetical protein
MTKASKPTTLDHPVGVIGNCSREMIGSGINKKISPVQTK